MRVNSAEMDYGVTRNKGEQEIDSNLDGNTFSEKEVKNSIAELNDTIEALNKDLRFQIHEKSDRMMVEIVNLKNNEVIKEIPPKEVLDMIGRIREMVGLLIDEKI